MSHVVLTTGNNRVELIGDIPEAVEHHLQDTFIWVDPSDLTNPVYFYSDKFAYLGTLYSLAEELKGAGVSCRIDLPELGPPEHPEWAFEGTFRYRQDEAVDTVLRDRYGVIKAPTGLGKTVIISACTARIGKRTAIIVQSEEPFTQAYDRIREWTNIKKVGRLSGKHCELQSVTVYMVQSLVKTLEEDPDGAVAQFFKDSEVVFIDEVHHAGADSYLKIINALNDPKYVFGFSATPDEREDGLQPFVDACIGKPRMEITYGEAVEAGVLCPVTVYCTRVPEKVYGYSDNKKIGPYAKGKLYKEVYDDYIVNNRERNELGLEFVRDMIAEGESVAIIVQRIEHIKVICDMYPEAVPLYSHTSNRKAILSKLRAKEIMCVVTTLFNEATDVPSLGAVCMLAGGKSAILLKQRLRSLRVFEGETALGWFKKERGYVWYPIDQADFLRSHSTKCMTALRLIVKEHPSNKLFTV